MKKILCYIISAVLLSSAALSGCDFIISDSNTKDNVISEQEDTQSDEGEVEFHFFSNDDNPSKDRTLPKVIEPSTCPLSDSAIQYVTTNAENIIAQYPDFSGTVECLYHQRYNIGVLCLVEFLLALPASRAFPVVRQIFKSFSVVLCRIVNISAY